MAAWRSATDRKTPRLRRRFVRTAKKPSTALSQEAPLGYGGVELSARGPRLVAEESIDTLGGETLLPAPDAGLGFAGLAHDRIRAEVLGAEQHDLRSPHVFLRRVAVFDQIAKPIHVGRGDREGDAGSHAADSHRASPPGIPTGIQISDAIH
jgi:hypothetical protein